MTKPSLTLIARKCAVSKMTVSRVLRNEPNVSPATREFVLRVAEKVGFHPSGHLQRRPGEFYPMPGEIHYGECLVKPDSFIVKNCGAYAAEHLDCLVGMLRKGGAQFFQARHIMES